MVTHLQEPAECAKRTIRQAQKQGTAAGADGVQQVQNAFAADLGGHGNLSNIQIWKAGADTFGASDNTAYACADIISALVTHHLQRHSRRDAALERGIARTFTPRTRERREKAS